jgi:hypothetical protein
MCVHLIYDNYIKNTIPYKAEPKDVKEDTHFVDSEKNTKEKNPDGSSPLSSPVIICKN